MGILEQIVQNKRREIDLKKSVIPVSQLESSMLFEKATTSLAVNLRSSTFGIIAEHKRRSPSKPIINSSFSVEDVVQGYEMAGVSGISVLTDAKYFGGSLEDLLLARASVSLPILRKDFILDEYQIIEAKANGADVILLIAAALSSAEITQLAAVAKSLALEVLLEVHNEDELHRSILPGIDMIGVNNRNLKTFEVNLETSMRLSEKIPHEFVKVTESGLSSVNDIRELSKYGYQGFLIGERFMKTENAGAAVKSFIDDLNMQKSK